MWTQQRSAESIFNIQCPPERALAPGMWVIVALASMSAALGMNASDLVHLRFTKSQQLPGSGSTAMAVRDNAGLNAPRRRGRSRRRPRTLPDANLFWDLHVLRQPHYLMVCNVTSESVYDF